MAQNKDIVDWLLTRARGVSDLGAMLEGLSHLLRDQGFPLDRATVGAPLLHPIAQSSFCLWDPQNGVRRNFLVWDDSGLEKLRNSPMYAIYSEGRDADWRLDCEAAVQRYSVGPELYHAGFTHYLALALPFSDGSHKAFTVQTRTEGGFTDDQVVRLKACVPAIAAAVEHHVQRALAETLMNTFVGERAGKRVLDGQVHRGDGEMIEAVIWMSDLRGFTRFAAERAPQDLLDAINQYFELVTEAITAQGGEVLKFIGDAVLGIFPVAGGGSDPIQAAETAAFAVVDAKQDPDWPRGLDLGIGLHKGEVFYGNVGGRTRLDFTVIGQSVNLVSRVEALCRDFERPVLVTGAVARASHRSYEALGERRLKGFDHPVPIFAPSEL